MSETENKRKIKTAPFRMSFPHLLKARETEENGVKKQQFELNMLFPPDSGIKEIVKAALKSALVDKFGAEQSKWPKLKRSHGDILIDFAEFNANAKKPLPGDWSGWTLIRTKANVDYPPSVVGPTKDASGKFPTITDPREVYAGRWARATLEAYAYANEARKGGNGVTLGLLNVQLLKHDTKFGNAVSDPNSDFDNAPEEWAGDDDDWGGDEGKAPSKKEAANSDEDWG